MSFCCDEVLEGDDRGFDLTAMSLLYLIISGFAFFLDSVSQLSSDVTESVSVSLNRCFFTHRLPCNHKEGEILRKLCGS